MERTKVEQETILLYNEEEPTASIYTHDPKLIKKLKRLAEQYPEQVRPDCRVHEGAVSYTVPKKLVSVREPFSAERKKRLSEHQKKAGIVPPNRNKP